MEQIPIKAMQEYYLNLFPLFMLPIALEGGREMAQYS